VACTATAAADDREFFGRPLARASMDINNFHRIGSVSNAHAGNDFESIARRFFAQQGISRA
jgi:hypothetical protein